MCQADPNQVRAARKLAIDHAPHEHLVFCLKLYALSLRKRVIHQGRYPAHGSIDQVSTALGQNVAENCDSHWYFAFDSRSRPAFHVGTIGDSAAKQ